MLQIFIGFDERETVAFHVLAHSIYKRSSVPVLITPLRRETLEGFYSRERGKHDSTDFAITRFLVPYLCNYQGYGLFMDCDMLCLTDISNMPFSPWAAVSVVKHDYVPSSTHKFMNQKQTVYPKKNWSSVMMFNNAECKVLTPEYVETAPGLDLHQFKWCRETQIADLPKTWNWLVDEPGYQGSDANILHFTKGTPCFDDYKDCTASDLWYSERNEMMAPWPNYNV